MSASTSSETSHCSCTLNMPLGRLRWKDRQTRGRTDEVTQCSAPVASRDCTKGRAAVPELLHLKSTFIFFTLKETIINPKSEIAALTKAGSCTGDVS